MDGTDRTDATSTWPAFCQFCRFRQRQFLLLAGLAAAEVRRRGLLSSHPEGNLMAKRMTNPTTPAPVLPTELLTIEEAAERLNMSVRYLRRAVAERRIAFHRLGRAIRFDPIDLASFVQAGRVEPMTAETVWRGLRSVA
jgi:excisionase family DNA binding protein